MHILVVNGPNLGFLGQRQPEIYGHQGWDALPPLIQVVLGPEADRISLDFFQANGQGELIDRLERAWQDKVQGLIVNAGAYTHTSLALADCLAWIKIPCVEVHLSNVHARDTKLRHQSLLAGHCLGTIAGFGLLSYALGVQALWHYHQQTHGRPSNFMEESS